MQTHCFCQTVDARNPASIKQHMRSSNSNDPRAPQLNVVSMFAMCDAGFGSFNFFCFRQFLNSMLKREREGIHEFVRPVVQDFVHQQ